MNNSYLDFIFHSIKSKKHEIVTIQEYFNIIPEKENIKKRIKRLLLLINIIFGRTIHIKKKILQSFCTDGYFACSVGNVSEEMLKQYIENQG